MDRERLNNLVSDRVKRQRLSNDNRSSVSSSLSAFGTNGHQEVRATLPSEPQISLEEEHRHILFGVSAPPKELRVVDIDSHYVGPLLSSIYAPDIYKSLQVSERDRRPHPNYMETIQHDINHKMRALLVDWLADVSESFLFVPDTLYLTVYLMDWFLSRNQIEISRLQLLGITCMLIATKYEEVHPPAVDELCKMAKNVHTREEVLKLERQILIYCGFHVCAPSAKTFLRRYVRAAEAWHKFPRFELYYLANYLAELTLADYSFLKFLPSVIAASAVFLARWTLNQRNHPWDSTLEYYTSYKASDLKRTVLALRDLQLNTSCCTLTAIRRKFAGKEFRYVAVLSSPKLLDTLF